MEKKAEEDDYDSMEDFIVWSDEERLVFVYECPRLEF